MSNVAQAAQLIVQLKPAVRIRSVQPALACRVFEGKPITTALRGIPLLFNICAQAQAVAAVRAIENAGRLSASPAVEQRRDLLVALESLREHGWRLLLDWPEQLGLGRRTPVFAPIYQALSRLLQAANPDGIYTLEPGRQRLGYANSVRQNWLECRAALTEVLFGSAGDFSDFGPAQNLLDQLQTKGWGRLGDVASASLPVLPGAAIAEILQSDRAESFIAAPEWQGLSRETGPWPRQREQPSIAHLQQDWGAGLYARLAARIVETRALLDRITALIESQLAAEYSTASAGVAQIEAARGRLIHSVVLDSDQRRIGRYRILAPTDWNFHPAGVTLKMLQSIVDEHPQQAELIMLAIDPCVPYTLTPSAEEPVNA